MGLVSYRFEFFTHSMVFRPDMLLLTAVFTGTVVVCGDFIELDVAVSEFED